MRIASEPYLTWYSTLPTAHQVDIASIVSYMMPNNPILGNTSVATLPADFLTWISKASRDRSKAVGITLALIKLTEFFFIEERGTREDWDVTWEQLMERAKTAKDSGDLKLAGQIESQMLHEVPAAAEAWIASAESWKRLRMSTLSDNALYSCLRSRAA